MSELVGREQIRVVGFDLDQALYKKSPEIDDAIQNSLYEAIAETRGCTIDRARQLFNQLYRGGEGLSGSKTLIELGLVNGPQLVQEALENADLSEFLVPNNEDVAFLNAIGERYEYVDLITGSNTMNAQKKLGLLAIGTERFNNIITSDDASKSNGDAFKLWMSRYPELEPHNFFYAGDRFMTDYVVPSGLGIQAGIVNIAEPNPDYPCIQVPALVDLGRYLLK